MGDGCLGFGIWDLAWTLATEGLGVSETRGEMKEDYQAFRFGVCEVDLARMH